MIHAWYEKVRDQKEHIYFDLIYGENNGPGNYYRAPSFHNAVEFAVGLAGSVEIVIHGESHVLKEGDICFINSREPHLFNYTPEAACYVVLISRDFFNNVNQLGSISFPTLSKRREGFDMVKEYLDYAMKSWDPDSLLCKRAFADTLTYLMMRFYPHFPKREMEKQSAVLLDAVAYICEHYAERLTAGEVAAQFGYSVSYFSTAFNEFMGSSFSDYVNTCRMIEYQRLRREQPALSAVCAARMCGFGSMNTFYRAQQKFENDRAVVQNPPRKVIY